MIHKEKNLFIFDLNSHVYRTYFAAIAKNDHKKESSYYNGMPNYIIKGTIGLIKNEIEKSKIKPDYIALVLDESGENFRHKLYPEYKANRPPTDPELVFMRKCLFKLLALKGYPMLKYKGVEADDVIGTLSRKASLAGIKVTIFSKDKDLFQLVDENTSIFIGGIDKMYYREDVIKNKGVPPEKILDYLTFMGDVADNISGILGCGKKTTVEILNKFTLKEVVENPDIIETVPNIRGRKRIINYLKENKDFTLLMHELVKLKESLDLEISLKDLKKKEENVEAVNNAFSCLGLKYI